MPKQRKQTLERVGSRSAGGVDERLLAGNLSQDAAHDLSRPRLWQPCEAPMSPQGSAPRLCLIQRLSESELAQQLCTPPVIYACMQLLALLFKGDRCLTTVPGAQWMTSGVAMGPITSLTVAISSFFSDAGGGYSVPCTHTPFQT